MPRGGARLRTPDGQLNGIAARVASRRRHLTLAQDELCARIAQSTHGRWNPAWQDISRIEHGARLVTDLEIVALAQVLECSACWLLTGRE